MFQSSLALHMQTRSAQWDLAAKVLNKKKFVPTDNFFKLLKFHKYILIWTSQQVLNNIIQLTS